MTYCVDLDLHLPLFNSELAPVDFLKSKPEWANNVNTDPKRAHHFTLDIQKDLSHELKEWFSNLNLKIVVAEVFYTYPNGVGSIHSDLDTPGDYSKLNWVLSGKISVMKWYKAHTTGSINTTTIDSYSIHYPTEAVELVHTQAVGAPSIVQVGCPHNIMNSREERFCLSIVFHDQHDRRITMSDAIKLFSNYIGRP